MGKRLVLPKPPGLPKAYPKLADALNSGRTLAEFKLHTSRAEVFRFANRFRFAKAFEGITLNGYSAPTERAYGALFRLVATWSALEQYLKVTRIAHNDADQVLLPAKAREQCLRAIRASDRDGRFFDAVVQRTDRAKLKDQVRGCIAGSSAKLTPILRAVRHSFVHGDLAPGANQASPGVAQKLAKNACPLVLGSIETDFNERITSQL